MINTIEKHKKELDIVSNTNYKDEEEENVEENDSSSKEIPKLVSSIMNSNSKLIQISKSSKQDNFQNQINENSSHDMTNVSKIVRQTQEDSYKMDKKVMMAEKLKKQQEEEERRKKIKEEREEKLKKENEAKQLLKEKKEKEAKLKKEKEVKEKNEKMLKENSSNVPSKGIYGKKTQTKGESLLMNEYEDKIETDEPKEERKERIKLKSNEIEGDFEEKVIDDFVSQSGGIKVTPDEFELTELSSKLKNINSFIMSNISLRKLSKLIPQNSSNSSSSNKSLIRLLFLIKELINVSPESKKFFKENYKPFISLFSEEIKVSSSVTNLANSILMLIGKEDHIKNLLEFSKEGEMEEKSQDLFQNMEVVQTEPAQPKIKSPTKIEDFF